MNTITRTTDAATTYNRAELFDNMFAAAVRTLKAGAKLSDAAARWLHHFRAGLDAADLTPEQDEQFWAYVTHAAQFLRNTPD